MLNLSYLMNNFLKEVLHLAYMNKLYFLFLLMVTQLLIFDSLFAQEITYNHDRGFYEEPFELTISTPALYNLVYYTIDCSTPTKENGTLYSDNISIDKTTVVKVKAYSPTDSLETTLSYIFLDDVIHQSNSNEIYPDYWADGVPAHYTLTTDITENPQYKDRLKPAFLSLPTISIATEVSSLFGTNGIYTNSIESSLEWERKTAVEFIFPESGISYATFSGLRIHGDASRIPEKSPKHSFKLYFRAEYGDAKLNNPLFDCTTNDKFDELVLRAGYNNSWIHFSGQQRISAQYIRDEWVRRSYKEMGNSSVVGDFFHLYVNGFYWGVYNATEKLSSDFMEEYLGGDKETWNVINSDGAVDGEVKLWTDLMSQLETTQTPDALYDILKTKIDVNNFIDYMILNYFTGMEDWGERNWYAACSNAEAARFHFFCWDSERSMEDVNHNILGKESENSPVAIFNKIKEVDEFVLLFADRVYKHLYNEGALTSANNQKRWEVLSDKVKEALIAESARWGNYRRDVHQYNSSSTQLYTTDEHWESENIRVYSAYYTKRNAIFINQLKSAHLYPIVEAPTYNFVSGYIDKSDKLEIYHENEGGTLYYTINGEIPGEYEVIIGEKYLSPINIEKRSLIRSRYLSAGGEWSPLNEIMLLPEQDFNSIMISEIMYNASSYPEFIELMNAGNDVISLDGVKFTEGIELNFNLEDKINPQSSIVVTEDSLVYFEKYEMQAQRQFSKKLKNEGETILLSDYFNNTIDSVSYEPISPWPAPASNSNKSIELIGSILDNSLATSWKLSEFSGGTPLNVTQLINHNSLEQLASSVITNLFTIYPNPATDYLYVKANEMVRGEKAMLLIYNSTGTLIFQDKIETSDRSGINISYLRSGLYIFIIKTQNQSYKAKVVIE